MEAAKLYKYRLFERIVFSWSLEDILNEDLYKHQVEDIPLTFKSEEHYVGSFVYPLLEETRAELASSMEIMYRAPYAELFSLEDTKGRGKFRYDVTVGNWRNKASDWGKEPYRTLPGDLLVLADGKPESVSDLLRVGRTLAFLLVNHVDDEDDTNRTSMCFKVKAWEQIKFQEGMFVVFLMNITSNKRIWNSLHNYQNMNIIKEVLYTDCMVKEGCNICSFDCSLFSKFGSHLLDKLNESQAGAIKAVLCKTECCHGSFVEQIWGPPGTGKTTTVSVLLYFLLQMNRRILTCTPTNVAIVQVASRVLKLVKESSSTTTASGNFYCCVGDVLLFGNKQRLKVGTEIEEIYLENWVNKLREYFGSMTGWKHCIKSMVDLLKDCVSQYHVYAENQKENKTTKLAVKSFIEFVRDRFSLCEAPLRRCILTFLTHIPKSFMREHNFQNMVSLLDDLSFFKILLFEKSLVSKELEKIFTSKPLQNEFDKLGDISPILLSRAKSLSILRTLQTSLEGLGLPSVSKRFAIEDFCYRNASLIFCTTSTSYKLHNVKMKPFEILVIDEAAQLKEAESTIPLQLHGMKHAILIGDECQLPAMVSSNICSEAGFGRSLFGRLSLLGHSKHLLDVQYRMHPSISSFPNWKFYQNHILDAENVTCKSYEKQYLSGPMFGPYSFINVVGGREEKDDEERSWRNMVEVAIVIRIVHNLYKAWKDSKKKVSIGVLSPYAAQVVCIQKKVAKKYEKLDGFSVKVKTIDGFQGREEDIIILSTVRSNCHGSVGFLSSPQRTNVALTRARHCLWILGNERTLTNSEYVWKELVCDARNRHCRFDADADDCLKSTIIAAKKELDQADDLVHGNSVLFKHTKWKGSECEYRHSDIARVNGNCLKPICGFRHPVAQPPEEPPRYKRANVAPPAMYDVPPNRSNHVVYEANHVSDNEGINGKDVDEYSREPTPGFDVLVDNEVGDSEYYPNEEQFDIGRSVDYNVDHDTYHDEHDFDHHAWEDNRDESMDRLDRSDLRHRISQRRDSKVGSLRSVISRELPRDIHHDGPVSLSSRLRGRIKIPGRSTSPRYDHRSRVEREFDMRRHQRSRYSLPRPPHVSSNHNRFRDRIRGRSNVDFNNNGRDYRGYHGNGRSFRGLKSQHTDDGQTLGKRKHPPTDSQQFEGPKSLSEILKRKRGSVICSVNNEDGNTGNADNGKSTDDQASLNNKVGSVDEDVLLDQELEA